MTTWRWDHDIARAPDGWELPIRIGSCRKYRTRGMIERVKAALLKVETSKHDCICSRPTPLLPQPALPHEAETTGREPA
jgi:hypothetical protein